MKILPVSLFHYRSARNKLRIQSANLGLSDIDCVSERPIRSEDAPIIRSNGPSTNEKYDHLEHSDRSESDFHDEPDCPYFLEEDDSIHGKPQRQGKRVVFTNVEVREYSVTIGDHPYCAMGCPLSLDWDYVEREKESLISYEAHRAPRRSRDELRTTWDERRQILSEEGGCSELEIRRANRKLHRARSSSAKLNTRINNSFFGESSR